jgi:TonB-linked SusC/RagA family outer membrane protein
VVFKGYYSTSQRLNTSAVSKVTDKIISQQPVSDPLLALQGRMPGIYMQQTTGVPGGNINVQIRGQNSLRNNIIDNGNLPLYIVDGVPYVSTLPAGISDLLPQMSPLNSISPTDIESIEILKDADATAIYGSRGANGVILITTKKAKAGKTKYDLAVSGGVGKVNRKMHLLDTKQYLTMRNEAYKNDNAAPTNTSGYDLLIWDTTRYTDWQEVLIGETAHTTIASASVSGGNSSTQFLIRGNFYRESTVFPGNFPYQKGSGHFNLNHTSDNEKFQANLSSTYAIDISKFFPVDLTRMSLQLAPVAPKLYDEQGNLNWENSTFGNPLEETKRKYHRTTDNSISNLILSYEIISGLQLKSSFGLSRLGTREMRTFPIAANNPALGVIEGSSRFRNNTFSTWIIEPQIQYQKNISEGRLSLLVGTTIQESENESQDIEASGFSSDALLENLQAAADIAAAINYAQYKYNALFGRINFAWKEKYIINVTGRRDGSSRFGSNKQFSNFAALGTAWVFSDERFVKDHLRLLSFGKLRASYGTTGSDQIGNYGFMDTYLPSTYPYSGQGGLIPARLANPDFAWEENRKLEIALELGLIRDRVLISSGWYNNRSSNQLVGFPLSAITGFVSVQSNQPATVQNNGWEFDINSLNVKTRHLSWRTSINLTIPRNKLVAYPNIDASPYANTYVVGEPLTIRKTYRYLGLDAATGTYQFQDIDDDNVFSIADQQSIKFIGQKLYGGIQNSFIVQSFQLDIFFQFVKQFRSNSLTDFGMPGLPTNQPIEVLNRWEKPGDKSGYQRFSSALSSDAGYAYVNLADSDFRFSDASFIRLKNISIAYALPEKWISRVKLQNCKILLQGQNLITFTNYKGLDPETGNNTLPPLTMIVAGVQLSL